MGILAEGEAGLTVGEVFRKHGSSGATYYQWNSKYIGMSVPEHMHAPALSAELPAPIPIKRGPDRL
jgi:putative transposase